MRNKWIWMSGLLLLISVLLMGWVFPTEKSIEAFWSNTSDNNHPEALSKSKQDPVLQGKIQEIEGKQLVIVNPAKEEVIGYVTVTEETKLFQKAGAKLVKVHFEDLQEGMKVSVWQDDPILMIYPAQLTADEVVIE